MFVRLRCRNHGTEKLNFRQLATFSRSYRKLRFAKNFALMPQKSNTDQKPSPRLVHQCDMSFKLKSKNSAEPVEVVPEKKDKEKIVVQNKNLQSFTNGQAAVFTCLDVYRGEDDLSEEQIEELNLKKEAYAKQSRHAKTLVFEIVDLMLRIVDFENDETYTFRDANVKQLSYNSEEHFETLFVRIFPMQLVKMLEKFATCYEVIIYSVLPKRFLDQLRKQMPELDTCCDFILSLEDCTEGEECLVKDISIFL